MNGATDYAEQAADAVRGLIHAVLQESYSDPAQVDAVVGELSTLAYRMVQAIDQATTWLGAAQTAGRLRHDDADQIGPGTAWARVEMAREMLTTAAGDAHDLGDVLASVRRHTSHLAATERSTRS